MSVGASAVLNGESTGGAWQSESCDANLAQLEPFMCAVERLVKLRGNLVTTAQNLEEESAKAFSLIRDVRQVFARVTTDAASISALVRGDDDEHALMVALGLSKRSVELVRQSFGHADQALEYLSSVAGRLNTLLRLEQDYRETLRFIWVVTLGFKVEISAPDRTVNESTHALTQAMTEHHQLLKEHVGQQFDWLGGARDDILSLRERLRKSRHSSEARLHVCQSRLNKGLGAINAAMAPAETLEREVTEFRDQGARAINGLIIALQHHDIIKQKLAHVALAIQSLQDAVATDGMQPASITHDSSSAPASRDASVHAVCSIQLVQIDEALDEIRTMEAAIRCGIGQLLDSAAGALAACRRLERTMEEALDRSHACASLSSCLLELGAVLVGQSELARDLGATSERLRTEVIEKLREVARLAASFRVIGFNSRLQASRMPSGSAAAELSGQTQCAANDMLRASRLLTNGVAEVAELLQSVESALRHFQDSSMREHGELVAAGAHSHGAMERVVGTLLARLQQMDADFSAAGDGARELLARLTFSQVAGRRIGAVRRELVGAVEATRLAYDSCGGDPKVKALIDQVHDRYAMRSERELHEGVIRESLADGRLQQAKNHPALASNRASDAVGATPCMPWTTLGGVPPTLVDGNAPNIGHSSDDLGDNVELF